MAEKQPLLELKDVKKSYGAVKALRSVDFRAYRGEVMALVGDNGAGKSTLVKGIAGTYSFDAGSSIFFEGQKASISSPRDASALGIEIVYQDLALADNLDVVANMFLGREATRGGIWLSEAEMEKAAIETLNSLEVTTLQSVRGRVDGLSGGQRQAIAVARAVMWNSKLVILDEPTAALGVVQTRQVLNLVRRLADQDLAVVIISHNMNDVFEVCDRVTVLRLGEDVGEYMVSDESTTKEEIIRAMTAGESKADKAKNRESA